MIVLKNTLSDEYLYCKEFACAKEIDEQKFCVAFLDKGLTRPTLVNMEYWKPKKNAKPK